MKILKNGKMKLKGLKMLDSKIKLIEWMVSHTDENEYFEMVEELGLCPKQSVVEVLLDIEK